MYAWVVYPADSTQPMTATGVTDDEGKARGLVETILRISGDHGWGEVIAGGIERDVCRRTASGFAWRPMFPGPE